MKKWDGSLRKSHMAAEANGGSVVCHDLAMRVLRLADGCNFLRDRLLSPTNLLQQQE